MGAERGRREGCGGWKKRREGRERGELEEGRGERDRDGGEREREWGSGGRGGRERGRETDRHIETQIDKQPAREREREKRRRTFVKKQQQRTKTEVYYLTHHKNVK